MRTKHAAALMLVIGTALSPLAPAAAQPKPPAPAESDRPKPSQPKDVGISLRPRYEPGRTTRYRMNIESTSKMHTPGSSDPETEQSQADELTLLVRTKSVSESGTELEIVYERLKSSLRTPEGDFTADSAAPSGTPSKPSNSPSPKAPAGTPKPGTPKPGSPKPGTPTTSTPQPSPADPLDSMLDALDPQTMLQQQVASAAGTVLQVTLGPTGDIISVRGGENLGGGLGGLGGLGGAGGLGASGATNPKAVANWMTGGLQGPGSPDRVKVGESWTTRSSLAGTPVGALAMSTRYTLESASPDARIAFKGQIEPSTEAPAGLPGIQVRSASYTGSAQWDPRRGELAGVNATTDVRLGGQVVGTAIESSSRQQVRVTRVP